MAGSKDKRSGITLLTLLRVFTRSFFIQGSFSFKYRQNTGFAFSMVPVGKALWKNSGKYREFLLRHLEYYNGNPFMITLALGSTARLEELYRNGEGITERDITAFKKAVGAATGSVGDRIFWATLRPFALVLGMTVTLFSGFWGLAAVLAAFNLPNVALRWYWLIRGYRLGTGVVAEIQNPALNTMVQAVDTVTAVLLAFVSVQIVAMRSNGSFGAIAAGVGLFLLSMVLYKRDWELSVVLAISLCIVLVSGYILSFV